jgi:glycosyltransferase involved in cell wall biosynthesis
MKVACVSAFPAGPKSAGLNLELIPLSSALAGIGHTLVLLAPSAEGTFVQIADVGQQPGETPVNRVLRLPTEIREAAADALTRLTETMFPPVFGISDLRLALDSAWESTDHFDAVMAYKPYFRTVLPCLRAAKRIDAPSLLWFDDFDVNPEARFLSKFDLVVCNSRTLADKLHAARVLYLPHVVDVSPLQVPRDSLWAGYGSGIIILFPSTGFPARGADQIIRSSLSAAEGLPVYIVNCPPSFRHDPNGGPSNAGLVLLPYLPRQELLNLVSHQSIAVVPQPETPYGRFKASGRLLECLALGIPSIVPDSGESKLIVETGGCGMVYDPGDTTTLIRAIRTLRQSPALRREKGSAGLRLSEARGTWGHHARVFAETIEKLHRDGPHSRTTLRD